ncbi:MAG TPA: cupin domain-containing protein [Stellaceae bacterium]|nr:cupin domain-containing protein [Stellaceae bacterium]
MSLGTKRAAKAADATAADGMEVRLLCGLPRGQMALFSLAPGRVGRAVAHRTVEEIWYFILGSGRMWRKFGDTEEIVEVGPGVSVSVPVGTQFQLRCDGAEPLAAVAVTMPPWPGEAEAYFVDGVWQATV